MKKVNKKIEKYVKKFSGYVIIVTEKMIYLKKFEKSGRNFRSCVEYI